MIDVKEMTEARGSSFSGGRLQYRQEGATSPKPEASRLGLSISVSELAGAVEWQAIHPHVYLKYFNGLRSKNLGSLTVCRICDADRLLDFSRSWYAGSLKKSFFTESKTAVRVPVFGEVFDLEISHGLHTFLHPKWSLHGEGDSLSKAYFDLVGNCRIAREGFSDIAPEELTADARRMVSFLKSFS